MDDQKDIETNTEIQHIIKKFSMRNGNTLELYKQDCLKGLDIFSNKYFDIVVTSPPYNLGIYYGKYNDKIPRSEYLEWFEKVAVKIKDKLKDNGSFFLNIGSSPTNPWGPFEIITQLRKHYSLQNVIHWIKSIYIENESYNEKISLSVGHYKPILSNRFVNDNHEYIFHLTKSGNVSIDRFAIGVPYKDTSNIKRWKSGNNRMRCRGNTWFVPYKTIKVRDKDRPHPATFPIDIAEKCIKLHGISKNTKVLDPFMGIGHTSIACHNLGTTCVGFEIDPVYYQTNLKTLEDILSRKISDDLN